MKENEHILLHLEELAKQYRLEKSTARKIFLLWEIGNFLLEKGITSQRDFWQFQNQSPKLTRALLLRAYWLATAFSKKEVRLLSQTHSKISSLFKILPLLGKKSKLSKAEQLKLKKQLLKGQIPSIKVFSKSTTQSLSFDRIPEDELIKLRDIIKNDPFFAGEIKKAFTHIMLLLPPTEEDLTALAKLSKLTYFHNFHSIFNTLEKLYKIWKRTRSTHVIKPLKLFIQSPVYRQLLYGLTITDELSK